MIVHEFIIPHCISLLITQNAFKVVKSEIFSCRYITVHNLSLHSGTIGNDMPESFFGHKSKHRSLHTIPVTIRDGDKAMKYHTTRYGRLRKHSHAQWRTHTPDSYSCKWMTTRRRTYNHLR